MSSTSFKVGDRVEAWKPYDDEMPTGTGTIVDIVSYGIEVDFPDWNSGHQGTSPDTTKKSRWFFGIADDGVQSLRRIGVAAKKNAGIKIERNIPIPTKRLYRRGAGRPAKYPFARMKIGDSFAVYKAQAVRAAAQKFQRKNKVHKFVIRRYEEAYRCWRVK